ncbi:MAG: GntR family transcriptional regulator [bacterium]|nr:GntR family transcriptional regulator [bacterium]
MHLEISPRDGMPIYRQIVQQVTYQIASGQLVSDQELPPIRSLAEQLLVTPNTIAKAYRELESSGLVYKRQGAGTFVADIACSPLAKRERRRILTARADSLLAEARQLGFDFKEVIELLHGRQAVLERSLKQEQSRVG